MWGQKSPSAHPSARLFSTNTAHTVNVMNLSVIASVGGARSFETRYGSRVAIVGGGMLGTTLSLRYRQAGRVVTLFDAAERSERRGHVAIASTDRHLLNLINELDLSSYLRWSDLPALGKRFGALAGGRAQIIESLRQRARAIDVDIRLGTTVSEIRPGHAGFTVHSGAEIGEFDQVILAVPGPVASELIPALPDHERTSLARVRYIGIVTVSFVLKRRSAARYLSRVERGGVAFTIVDPAALEPTGDSRSAMYVSRPLPDTHELFRADDRQVIEHFARALPGNSHIVSARVIRAPNVFAQSRLSSLTSSIAGLSIINAAHMGNGRNHLDRTAALAMNAFRTLCAERIS